MALLEHISEEGKVDLNFEDEIVKGSVITRDGEVVQERTKSLLQ
ncbi:MAG: hypothetical protein U5K00_14535 [Melioribacteraceae bacterium]|nr:hypothetical protein [Melioribacteraceae bacterium]